MNIKGKILYKVPLAHFHCSRRSFFVRWVYRDQLTQLPSPPPPPLSHLVHLSLLFTRTGEIFTKQQTTEEQFHCFWHELLEFAGAFFSSLSPIFLFITQIHWASAHSNDEQAVHRLHHNLTFNVCCLFIYILFFLFYLTCCLISFVFSLTFFILFFFSLVSCWSWRMV